MDVQWFCQVLCLLWILVWCGVLTFVSLELTRRLWDVQVFFVMIVVTIASISVLYGAGAMSLLW